MRGASASVRDAVKLECLSQEVVAIGVAQGRPRAGALVPVSV